MMKSKLLVCSILVLLVVSMFACFIPYASAADTSSNIVAYWGFEEGQGLTAQDYSGNSHTGVLNSTSIWTQSGKFANGLDPLTGNFVTVPASAALLPSSITISVWVKLDSLSTGVLNPIISNNEGFIVAIDNATLYATFYSGGSSWTPHITYNVGTTGWILITVYSSPTSQSLWVNGVSVNASIATYAPGAGSTIPTIIGGTAAGVYFHGLIDDVRIYSRILAPADITYIYSNPAYASYNYIYYGSGSIPQFDDQGYGTTSIITVNVTTSGTSFSFPCGSQYGHCLIGSAVSAPLPAVITVGPSNNTLYFFGTPIELYYNSSSLTTRVYNFENLPMTGGIVYRVYLSTPSPATPAQIYDFSVTNFGSPITNAYITITNPYGLVTERKLAMGNLDFVMQQYLTYTITLTCDQGTFTQSFTAGTIYSNSFIITSDALPQNTTAIAGLNALRTSATQITISVGNDNATTTYLYVELFHSSSIDSSIVIDYTYNYSVSGTSFSTTLTVTNTTDYFVMLTADQGSNTLNQTFSCPAPIIINNPFTGKFIIFGTMPNGIDPAQLICLIAVGFCMLIGSTKHVGFTCLIGCIAAGFLALIGWFIVSAGLFGLAIFLAIVFAIQEARANRAAGGD